MLEYFTYKKVKKHKAEKAAKEEAQKSDGPAAAEASNIASNNEANEDSNLLNKPNILGNGHRDDGSRPVLHPDDENFIEELLASHEGPAPPLPPRLYAHDLDWPSDNEGAPVSEAEKKNEAEQAAKAVAKTDTAEKTDKKADKKPNRLSMLFTKAKKSAGVSSNEDGLKPESAAADIPEREAEKEKHDLGRVLDRLNLSAKNNKVVSMSNESSELLQKFTQVFKDLVNGVPTAYDDLAKLIEDRDGTIARGFDKLPSSLQKLVTQLPDKLTGSLAPEILAAAAASQGVEADKSGGAKGMAKKMFMPQNVMELVTKPGAIVGMLRAIVEALKTRWPAFIGMNVIWSVALTLLMFVLWYCYKRGREVRLERENTDTGVEIADADRVEELPDDPALPAPSAEPADDGDAAVASGSDTRPALAVQDSGAAASSHV